MVQESQDGASLSWGDTFFLYLEREGQPLNIASVCEFDGRISLAGCRRFIGDKLPLMPRYQQRVVTPPFNVGLPTWELDPHFDLRNHVREVTLKGGTDSDVKALAAALVSERMDRSHPLWDFTLVRGLKSHRTCAIFRVHHCLADGISGVGLMKVLMDPSPNPPKVHFRKRPAEARAFSNPDSGAMVLDRLLKAYSSILQSALQTHSEVMHIVQDVIASAGTGMLAELIQLAPELATPAERLPFNQVCRGPQTIAWASVPLPEIKAIRTNLCGTVNDVILTVMTLVFQRYAELRGAELRGRQLRVIVPINIRGDGDPNELGNRITFLPINVPLDVRDAGKLLATISQRMTFLRSVGVAEFVGLAGTVVSKIPLPVQALLAPVASQLPLSLCNTICTNVPGPQYPLYMMGHKLLRCYPYVPIGGEMGINTAIMSYDGVVYFGYSGDVHAAPDLERLEKFTDQSFADLKKAAGLKAPPKPARGGGPRKKAAGVRKKAVAPAPGTRAEKPAVHRRKAVGSTNVTAQAAPPSAAATREPEMEFAQVGD